VWSAVALGAAALVAVGYLISVGTDFGLRADDAAVPQEANNGIFRRSLTGATHLNPVTASAIAIAILALASRRGRGATAAVAIILVGASATAFGLEQLLADADPLDAEGRRALGAGFFPSGHSATGMALVLTAVLVTRGRLRDVTALLGSICAALLGIGNLVTESHHLSDVLAGYLVAAAWAGGVVAATRDRWTREEGRRAATTWKWIAAGLVVPALLVAGFTLERPDQEVGEGFLAASLAIALVATALPGIIVAISQSPVHWHGRGARGLDVRRVDA
jgi:membrane-associated phospholipid phosphatase